MHFRADETFFVR